MFEDLAAELLVCTETRWPARGSFYTGHGLRNRKETSLRTCMAGTRKKCVGHSHVSDNTRLNEGTAFHKPRTTPQFVADLGDVGLERERLGSRSVLHSKSIVHAAREAAENKIPFAVVGNTIGTLAGTASTITSLYTYRLTDDVSGSRKDLEIPICMENHTDDEEYGKY